ncbi:LYR motif-containing protein 5, partial [Ophiophagus hannah]
MIAVFQYMRGCHIEGGRTRSNGWKPGIGCKYFYYWRGFFSAPPCSIFFASWASGKPPGQSNKTARAQLIVGTADRGRIPPLRVGLEDLQGPFQLLYLGKEYPKGADYFRTRLKAAFLKNKEVKDPEEIKKLIARGKFVIKELEALYFLRKYRALKQRYYEEDS